MSITATATVSLASHGQSGKPPLGPSVRVHCFDGLGRDAMLVLATFGHQSSIVMTRAELAGVRDSISEVLIEAGDREARA